MSEMSHIFISYSRKNQAIVEQLRADLQQAGITIWIDKVGLQPGTPDWDQALRDAIAQARAVIFVASPSSRRSPYVRDEIALAKDAKKSIYPVWIEGDNWMDCIPMGLGSTQNVDLRDTAYAKNLTRLIGSLSGQVADIELAPIVEAPLPVATPLKVRNPYKGLRAFRAEDRADFFGRDALVETLLEAVEQEGQSARLLAVLGASGSGKSSVMMAGLLPKLQKKHPDWNFLDPIVPGSHPLENLTIALAREFEKKSQTAIREDLLDVSTRGLHRLARELSDQPLVLYIDQFEEVFTLVDEESERRQFIDLLTTASSEADGVLYLLLSMRADFYDRPLQYNLFGDLLGEHHIPITSMTLADLYDVVQRPAALADVALNFDEGLVTEMVFAVREEAAALPLLQFTLDQLFQQREGQTLSLDAYETLGGVQGALAKHAEATYQHLASEQHKTLARALFLRLIEAGQTEQDTTRRRASYSELTLADVNQTHILQEVADKFVEARLLVSDQSEDERTLEVSHEALIREWQRLGDWLRAAREDLRLQKSLSADVAEWKRRNQPQDMLYRGTVLAEAFAWAENNTASRDETLFLNESQRAETERQAREAQAARRLRYLAFGLVGVIVLASVGLILILSQNNATLQADRDDLLGTGEAAIVVAETAQNNVLAAQFTLDVVFNDAATQGAEAQTARADLEFANLEIARFGTLQAAGVIVPLGTQTPGIFEPTLTAIAILNSHDPSLPENQMSDEFSVEIVRVPAGCFFMGSDRGDSDELPIHQVCFEDPFWIDKYEVSNEQFDRLHGEAEFESFYCDPYGDGTITSDERSACATLPREQISWFEARDFCELREARLPSEAEWEYAARGVNSLTYPWGNEFVADNVVSRENSNNETAPVGSRAGSVSWVGAYDMSGNVWEWVSTIYEQESYLYSYPYATDDGREDNTDQFGWRVFRGGAFFNDTNIVRSAFRSRSFPDDRSDGIGFRCARSYP